MHSVPRSQSSRARSHPALAGVVMTATNRASTWTSVKHLRPLEFVLGDARDRCSVLTRCLVTRLVSCSAIDTSESQLPHVADSSSDVFFRSLASTSFDMESQLLAVMALSQDRLIVCFKLGLGTFRLRFSTYHSMLATVVVLTCCLVTLFPFAWPKISVFVLHVSCIVPWSPFCPLSRVSADPVRHDVWRRGASQLLTAMPPGALIRSRRHDRHKRL